MSQASSSEPLRTEGLSLAQLFLRSAAAHPERPALLVNGVVTSYAQLRTRALRLAGALVARRGADADAPPLTAVLTARSEDCFTAILGAACSGHGYVPMLTSFPPARISLMLARSGARTLIVDRAGLALLDPILAGLYESRLVVVLSGTVDDALRERHHRHRFLTATELGAVAREHERDGGSLPVPVGPEAIAYLLFTSGSTGEPKGVMVAQRNIARFLEVVIERYGLRESDRFSHLFETTFDLSLFDIFGAFTVGGCLCVPNPKQRMLPHQYLAQARVSVYFSVPSAALLMKQMRLLTPGVFPDLRLVLFCGEALPARLAMSFVEAAPEAVVENIYGPTELTLACTAYRWDPATSEAECENELVPIGEPFPGMRAKVVDDMLREVEPGETGELIMAGPQRALGYWNDPKRTDAAFLVPPGEDELFYRTGDRVRRPTAAQPMTFLGRTDSQVKIHGYRVELGEIEAVLKRESDLDAAVVLAWPIGPNGGATGVVAFLAPPPGHEVDVDALLDRTETHLPRYMVPKRVHLIESFPLNSNGKIDRNALRARLEQS